MKTLEENNRMIAEFMGAQTSDGKYYMIPKMVILTIPELMKYQESWDWLMPVVEKIDNLETDEEFTENMGDITHALIDINIDELYYQVCLFIEKYNKQQICSN